MSNTCFTATIKTPPNHGVMLANRSNDEFVYKLCTIILSTSSFQNSCMSTQNKSEYMHFHNIPI